MFNNVLINTCNKTIRINSLGSMIENILEQKDK